MKSKVKLHPINSPVNAEILQEYLDSGWSYLGQFLTMDDNNEVSMAHAWAAHPYTITVTRVAQIVLESESKDELSEKLFGMPLEEVHKIINEE